MQPVFNRSALRPGDIISRYSGGPIAWSICFATGQWKINHDALIVPDRYGNLCAGDALMGPGCQLTPLREWEANCIEQDHRVLIGRPVYSTAEDGLAAATYWREHIAGKHYDHVALLQILRKKIFGTWWPAAVGVPSRFYCSEGVRDSWHNATNLRPWHEKNVDPGSTVNAYRAGALVEVSGAFTQYGEQWRVDGVGY